MKLTILQSNFSKAINQVSRVVGARTTLPVLNNILLSATKGKIELSATDLEIGIITSTIGKIEEEGEITLPAKLLTDFIANNRDESIEVITEGTKATLKSAHYEAEIVGISAEEFPKIPTIEQKEEISLAKDQIFSGLKKTVIATANDETRPVLAGVFFSFDKNELILAATDSYRLSEIKIKTETEIPERKMIVPSRTINEVIRLMSSDSVEKVMISSTPNQVSFRLNETQIVSRLIEGAFPNYKQIIPTESKIKVTVDFGEFQAAVKMSSLFAKDSANNNVKIKTGKDTIIISSALLQTGSAKSEIAAKITGGEIEVAFNARYILDILPVISSKKIEINLNDSFSAGIVSSPDEPDFIYIIMPLKLDN